jgi:sarcosine oxidase, subunit gamma
MVDIAPLTIAARDLALGLEAVKADGVRISPTPAMARYSLRARDPEALAEIIGRAVPARIGETLDGIACLGPDEWLALLPDGTALPFGEGQAFSIVDVSSRAVGIVVEGPGAAALVGAGCPLDMERFSVGRTTRTLFETVEIVCWRTSETRFHIDVWRSFAPWLWNALVAAV